MFVALLLGAACLGIFSAPAAHAAMQLDRTRLVLTEAEGSAIVQAHSADALPLLLQAWIDAGAEDGDGRAQSAPPAAPFVTDPPVMRLNPGHSRTLRVLRVDAPETLPTDRESLYWLNILEVPVLASDSKRHRLNFSVQSRLKLFYRPRALARYQGYEALPATDRLRFALEEDAAGEVWLRLDNPAPIYQSLATLALHLPDNTVIELDAPMLAPFDHARLALPVAISAGTRARLHFATLNDDGHLIKDTQTL